MLTLRPASELTFKEVVVDRSQLDVVADVVVDAVVVEHHVAGAVRVQVVGVDAVVPFCGVRPETTLSLKYIHGFFSALERRHTSPLLTVPFFRLTILLQ